MSAIKKVKHFIQEQTDFKPIFRKIAKQYNVPVLVLQIDSLYCRFRYGAPTSQYIGFRFYQMNRHERDQYVTDGRTKGILKKLDTVSGQEADIINHKHLFNRTFQEFITREWIYVPEAAEGEIHRFLSNRDFVIAKPDDRTKGEGIRKINCAEAIADFPAFLERARQEKLLLEQIIEQHPLMGQVNPSSVNTIRVCSIKDKSGNVIIFAASLRGGGADSIVDNLHAGGAQYPIDSKTGIIIRGGVQFDGEQNIYFHPSTNQKMIGFEIPNWDKVVDTVTKAAKELSGLRYIGWDVAVTEAGCELVEGNLSQGCNGMQQDGVGKYKLIKRYY